MHCLPGIVSEMEWEKKPGVSMKLKVLFRGFPGGAVVKNPCANAGDTGSSPGPGRSHMPQSNPCATTTEPMLYSSCSTTREATAMRSPRTTTKRSPRSLQLESPCAATET